MSSEPGPGRVRARFVSVLCLAMAAGVFTQFALGALAPFIVADLSISRTAFGALSTSLYVVGGVTSPLLGRFVDSFGGRRSLLVLFATAGFGWTWMAAAPGYAWLLAGVGVTGLALAISNPATNLLVSVHVEPSRHGLVIGTKQAGALASAVVAGLLLPFGAGHLGWRGVLVVCAAVAIAVLTLVVSSVPNDDPGLRAGSAVGGARSLVRWLSAYAFFMGAGLASVFAYLPLYSYEELHLGPTAAGGTVSVMGAVGTVAVIVWTWGAGRIRRASGPLIALAGISAFAALAVWAAPMSSPLVWVGTIILGASGLSWFAVAFLAVVRDVGTGATGRASAVVGFAIFAGFVGSPIAFGWLVDATGTYGPSWVAVTACFVAAAAVGVGWHRRSGLPQATSA